MRRTFILTLTISLFLSTAITSNIFGRAEFNPDETKENYTLAEVSLPFCIAAHNVGKLVLAINNNGTFGSGFSSGATGDCFSGSYVPSCEYPKGSGTSYLFAGAFWIGAIVGRDTLVSVGADGWSYCREMYPYPAPFGIMQYRSILNPNAAEYEGAVSEQDFIAVYTDTYTTGVPSLCNDAIDGRPHRPLNIEVTQRSYAWSYPYAEDFILFDYSIKNIGQKRLNSVFMGLYVDADVNDQSGDVSGFTDDICGFLYSHPNYYKCKNQIDPCICDSIWEDTVFIAWIADNDGELKGAGIGGKKLPNVTGMRIIRTPADSLDVSFNWWVSNGTPSLDFGPRRKSANFRDLGTGGLGTPEGDRNKYAFLRNREFDYDQIFTAAITATDSVWYYPNQVIAKNIADGYDTRFLLSFGPFNIEPGQTLPLSFAYLGGENFHVDPDNLTNNITDNYDPKAFYENLNFTDIGLNSMWASWVYDNPGIDNDDDDFFGEFRPCYRDIAGLDTCCLAWYKGDNIPDFRGAQPPPPPDIVIGPERTEGGVGEITLRWNGFRSETTEDAFSKEYDFEGYRVYLARDNRETSFSLVSSYDIEDYNIYQYYPTSNSWELIGIPLPIDSIRCRYASSCDDSLFNPQTFTRSKPLVMGEDIYYFESQDYNRSKLANEPNPTTEIRKVYYDEIEAGIIGRPTTARPEEADPIELTPDGNFKFYEYEYTIKGLLNTVPYYITVTAFDFGSPETGVGALETAVTLNAIEVYPQNSATVVDAQNLPVYIYPNPYRIDGNYTADGFEARNALFDIPDRERRIHFANLPAKCMIRIYSLDGDLIRELEHNEDPGSPTASHDTWDLISRNTQLVVTGIYYWVVEAENGETQIGKLVIIM